MIRAEQPILIEEAHVSLHAFARRLADWIAEPSGHRMHRVAGVYGGRGTGKTSVLMTVLEMLRRDQEGVGARAEPVSVVLPNCDEDDRRNHRRAILTPSETRDHDDLLFLLLSHFEHYYLHENSGADTLREAREAEVRRKDIERFLRYEETVSPSSEQIPSRLVRVHNEVSRTTSKLRDEFIELINACRQEHGQTLVLFIDDLDLQPHRALELLEIVGLFLGQPGVTVLIAADRDLLLRSIDEALRTGRRRHAGLAAALLTKHIPHAWVLPMPSQDERLDILWRGAIPPYLDADDGEPELPRWWPGADMEQVRQDIGPLLPRTYRGLKAMHNLLDTLRMQYAEHGTGPIVLKEETRRRLEPLSISDATLLPPVLAMMAALDVQYPQVSFLAWLLDETMRLGQDVSELAALEPPEEDESTDPASASEEAPSYEPAPPYELPERVRHRLAPPYLDQIDCLHAREQVLHLLRSISALRVRATRQAVARARFLAVSLNADAMAMAEPAWQGRFKRDEVAAWHIDLRDQVENLDDIQPEEIDRAHGRAAEMLRDRGVLDYAYPVWLHIKARLSLALWLGWEMRYLRQVRACSNFGREVEYFDAPAERIPFRDTNRYEYLEPDPRPSSGGTFTHAVVLIDLLGRSTPDNLEQFELADELDIPAAQRYRLSAPPGQRIEQRNVVPLLEDVIELLGHLRYYNRVQHFHLAFIGPDFMACFLGRELNAMGQLTVYDYYSAPERRYARVLTFDTHG